MKTLHAVKESTNASDVISISALKGVGIDKLSKALIRYHND